MEKDNNKKKSGRKEMLKVELASLNDMARYACGFNGEDRQIFLSGDSIFSLGEQIGDAIIAYTLKVQVPEGAKALLYEYSPEDGTEKVSFVSSAAEQIPGRAYLSIIRMGMENFDSKEEPEKGTFTNIKIDFDGLVKCLVRKGVAKECLEAAYLFQKGAKTFACAFDAIEDLSQGSKAVYTAEQTQVQGRAFARYDYSRDSVDFSDTSGEHKYMYIKLINLKSGFPFLKE